MIKQKTGICSQEAVDQFPQEVNEVIGALGIGAALVTDESQVLDFLLPLVEGMDEKQRQEAKEHEREKLELLGELAGREVRVKDHIWELARDIHLRKMALRAQAEQRARPH